METRNPSAMDALEHIIHHNEMVALEFMEVAAAAQFARFVRMRRPSNKRHAESVKKVDRAQRIHNRGR